MIFRTLRKIPFFVKMGIAIFVVSALILLTVGVITFQFVTAKTENILKDQILPVVQLDIGRYHHQFQIFFDKQRVQAESQAEEWFRAKGNFLAKHLAENLLHSAEEFDIAEIQSSLQKHVQDNPALVGIIATINGKDQYSAGNLDDTGAQVFTSQDKSNFAQVVVEVRLSNTTLTQIFAHIAKEQNLVLSQASDTHASLLAKVKQRIQTVQLTNNAWMGQWLAIVGIGGIVTLFVLLMLIIRRLVNTLVDLEEQSRLILSSVNDGIVGVDQDSQTIFVNHAVSSLLGYTSEELYNQSLHNLIHYKHSNGREHSIENCPVIQTTHDGEPRTVEDDVLWRKDGTPVPVEYDTTPIYRDNKLVGAVMVFRDITARRATENALREASYQQQAIFDSATIGIAFMQGRTFRKCNLKFYELVGYNQDELIGQTTRCLYLNSDVYNEVGQAYANLKHGEIYQRTIEFQRKDRSRFWCHLSGSIIIPGNLSYGTVWTLRDITLEREALESLQRSKNMAETAMRMKSEFLANMSHEIRTPMNAIIGLSSHLIVDTELTSHQHDCLQRIEDSSQHLLSILNNIIDLSRIEAGKMTMDQREFKLSKIFDIVAGEIAAKSRAKGLKFSYVVAPEVPNDLIGDASQLKRILVNYADNAIKFTEQGEISLHVGVREQGDQDVLLHCAVRDTGLGLTEKQQQQLFLDFSQVDASITRHFGGVGMGLIITKRLVESMGGEVGVNSVPGQGSTFWFTVRLGLGSAKFHDHQETTMQAPGQIPQIVTPPNLIVDEERVKEVCANLIARLADEDFEAHRIFEANAELLQTALGDENYREIKDGIHQFDFEKALRVFNRASW